LLAPSGSGTVVNAASLTNLGGYVGAPYVLISGGGGTGATAVALFDYTQNIVTGIVVTSRGVGYTNSPSVTLIGGGNTNYDISSYTTLGVNTSGGLTKLGTGTLTLSGANTYGGDTVISNGTLKMGAVLALPSATHLYADSLGTLDLAGFSPQVSGLDGYKGIITNSTGSSRLTVNFSNSTTNNFLGKVTGASTLTLTGGGTLIATAASSFDSASQLVVSNGSTLFMNTTHAGIITTYGFSTNGGSGALATLNVMTNGVYMPGATLGLGTQTVHSLTLNPGGLLAVGLTTASNGLARVDTTFAMTNALLRLDLTQYTFVANQTFVVVNYTNTAFTVTNPSQWFTLQDFGPSAQSGQVLSNDLTFGVSGGLLNTTNFFRINYDALANGDPGGSMITLTAVPEPGTASLLGLVGVAFLVRRLRRRTQG
ncbi:MAG: autotransporter-associated beta strand repeat-containing protein, partial [Kiritimatiellaeota bacterium]|nr:autotransporter-associated beta strand repeat-containing protein [Kiritimatiellota bacterium]